MNWYSSLCLFSSRDSLQGRAVTGSDMTSTSRSNHPVDTPITLNSTSHTSSIMDYSQDSPLQNPPLAAIENDPREILSNLRHAHDFSTDDRFIQDIVHNAQKTSMATLQNEKLELGKDGTKYLFSALKEASSLHAGGSSLTEEERVSCCLPSAVANRDFKSELSHIMTELTQSVNELCRKEDPMLVLNEAIPKLIARETANGDEGLELPDHFRELPGIVEQNFKTEKLDASKETASFLKSALGYLDEKEHRREIDRLFEDSALSTVSENRKENIAFFYLFIRACRVVVHETCLRYILLVKRWTHTTRRIIRMI
jgi:hypothetical protein